MGFEEDIYCYTYIAHLCSKDFQSKDMDLMVRKSLLIFML